LLIETPPYKMKEAKGRTPGPVKYTCGFVWGMGVNKENACVSEENIHELWRDWGEHRRM